MNAVTWQSLAWMLLHSLWQAGAVGTLLWLMLRRMPAHRAQGRYAVAVAALFVVVLGAVTTLTVLSNPSPDSLPTERAAAPVAPDANWRADWPNTTKLPESRLAPTPPSHEPLVGAPSAAEAAARTNTPGWEAAVVWLWLAGVLVMFIRMAGALRGASRLAAQAEICTSGCVCDMAKSLGRSLGLIRRVAVRVHPHLRVPAVVGLVRPVILLPLSAMSGLSPQQLEAVLLHELAHIRRHDLLVQIGQMLIEAMLFFNPAVWWISRQVRIEREACADFAAARLLGRPDRYVQALADWAQRLSSHGQAGEVAGITSASLAMADPKREHSLLERAHRLLVADYRPRLKLPWHTLAGLLLFGALLMGGLWQGANLAVRAAVKVFSPQERIEAIEQVRQTHGEPARQRIDPYDPANMVTISGTILTTDGSPVPMDLQIRAVARWERLGSSGTAGCSFGHQAGHFSVTRFQAADAYYLYVNDQNYALCIVGPLKAQPGGRIDDVQIVLSPGSTSTLRIIGPDKRPVAGAVVKHSYPLRMGSSTHYVPSTGPQEADTNGKIILPRAADMPLQVEVLAAGYQFDRFEINPASASVHDLCLTAATPATGTIIDRDTGEPLAGAEIRLVKRTGTIPAGHMPYSDSSQPPLATTDAQGRFILDTLRDEAFYTLRLDAPDHGPKLVFGIKAGQRDQTWQMGPPRVLKGIVVAGLDKLNLRTGQPTIRYGMSVEVAKDSSYNSGFDAPVQIEQTETGEVGRFQTHNLLPGTLTLEAVTPPVKLDTRSLPESPLELDLRTPADRGIIPPKREVVFRVVVPDGLPPAQGTLRLDYLETSGARGYTPVMDVPLTNGEVRYSMPVPTKVIGRGQNVPGYCVQEVREVRVPEGDEPFVVELPAIPAGAIYGRVLKPDGSPASNLTRVFIELQPSRDVNIAYNLSVERPNDDGRFFAGPLPLGGVYRIIASGSGPGSGAYVVSEPLRVDDATPLHEIELQFAQGMTVSGIVADETGKPIVGAPVSLHYTTPWGRGFGGAIPSDSQGRFRFEHVNPDVPGKYELIVRPIASFQSTVVEFEPGEKQMRIELKPGLRLEGIVINVVTGKPLANVLIEARPMEHMGRHPGQMIETHTDAQGRFVFDNLSDCEYMLRVNDAWPEGTTTFQKDGRTWYRSPPGDVNHFRPQKEPVEVRVTTQPPAQPQDSPLMVELSR